MRFCFILASLTGREHLLNEFVESAKTSRYKDADYYLYYQDVEGTKTGDVDMSFFKDVYVSHTRDGVCLPRMYWLHKLDGYDFYIIVDDDIEFLGKENYDTAMSFAGSNAECGLCCTVCYNTMKNHDAAVPSKTIKVKNLQWIQGGCVIKKSIRDLLVSQIDLKPYTYDAFCIVTYIAGYTNYQCWDGIVFHKAGRKHGFEYVRKNASEFVPWFEAYIVDPFKEQGKLTLPVSENGLTAEARMLHNKNREKMFYEK